MKVRKISTISFLLEKVSKAPLEGYTAGYHQINGEWFRDRVEIDGIRPECPAVDINEFYRMLRSPGDYEPFTCTCGNPECANIDSYVRCLHKGELIVMVIRDPLLCIGPCQGCKFEKDPGLCPAEHIFWSDCPFLRFRYRAYLFRREDMENELKNLERAYTVQISNEKLD